MEARLPNWMFASFAIAGWELFAFLAHWLHMPRLRYVGAGIVVVCALVLAYRFAVRQFRRWSRPGGGDDEGEPS
ncbi:hypothetical protein GCM10010885_19060 [Alicyclobacillus cellulosilyticus]|uniref:Uncharacterized protein n=1 Tax=Alicyclobacillus cellulosilyticus TaxID=1003997 RepID=A0A917KDF0_9BACL|nr:hypothetical protein [Alicyclobacillus cellulosilyticus]GGJ10094.1 hypothetical protein GCM10010885_19060 [Alicyclobacillus cellulosilyticus]